MSTLAIALPEDDLAFLRAWAAEQGTSAEDYLAAHAKNLRRNLQRRLHPAVVQASGVLPASEDAEARHREHLERKHG